MELSFSFTNFIRINVLRCLTGYREVSALSSLRDRGLFLNQFLSISVNFSWTVQISHVLVLT